MAITDDPGRDQIAASLQELRERGVLIHFEYMDGADDCWSLVRGESANYSFTASEVQAYISGAKDATEAHG